MASSGSCRQAATSSTPPEKFRLKPMDYAKIVDYLEVPENFQSLVGGGRRTKIGGIYTNKGTAFKQMACVLQDHGFPKGIDGPNLSKRFNRYLAKYKDAKNVKNSSGGGLTEDELAAGMTLEEKLDRMCPHFARMDAIYGARPNVTPAVIGDHGINPVDEFIVGSGHGHVQDMMPSEEEEGMNVDAESENYTEAQSPPVQANTGLNVNLEERPNNTFDNFWNEIQDIARKTLREVGAPSNGTIVLSADTVPPVPEPQCSSAVNGKKQGKNAGKNAAKKTKVLGDITNSTEKPGEKQVVEKPAPAKPNLAQIYSEKLTLKAQYRKELIETRDRWKCAELSDRQRARLEARMELNDSQRLARKHQLLMDRKAAANAEKKARLDAEHKLAMAKAERKTQLMVELVHSNKSQDELQKLLDLVGTD